MNSIMRAIGAVLRAMKRASRAMIRTTMLIGGKLVSVLLPAAIPAIDELEPEDVAPANDNQPISENQAIRDLAYAQAIGRMPSPQALGAVTALQADWIASMDAEMARRVLSANDDEIRAHLRGTKCIRGVLWCDEAAIDDYMTALAIDNARMERDLRLDQDYVPRVPA